MKLHRLIAILTALLQKDRISAAWFAEKFNVSIRTIYRDIQALESAGIPIVTHTGSGGGISIIEQYKIDQKLFTHQDIATLLTSLNSVSGSMEDAKLNQTLEKIKSLIPPQYGKSIELAASQLYIDITPWAANPQVSGCLQKAQAALESNSLLRFDYEGRHSAPSHRVVEPHQLVLKEHNWYLRAYCKERQDFRIFKLSRMRSVRVLAEHFEPRPFEGGMTDFKNWQNENIITVELLIDAPLRERMMDYCREELMRELDNGKIAVSLPFVESDMGYGVLLSLGHRCTVLSPTHVRDELLRRVQLLWHAYKGAEEI